MHPRAVPGVFMKNVALNSLCNSIVFYECYYEIFKNALKLLEIQSHQLSNCEILNNSESRKTQSWCYGVPNIVVFSGLYKAKCKNKIELFDIQNLRFSNHVKRYARYKFWSPKSKQQTKPCIGSICFLYMRIFNLLG